MTPRHHPALSAGDSDVLAAAAEAAASAPATIGDIQACCPTTPPDTVHDRVGALTRRGLLTTSNPGGGMRLTATGLRTCQRLYT